MIDFTTSTTSYDLQHGEIAAAEALAQAISHGLTSSQLTMSSDGNASLPIFNSSGQLLGLEVRENQLFAVGKVSAVLY